MGEPDDVHDGVPGVRQLMERLVETLVSGGLDDVVLRPNNPHPQYGRIYKRHQPRLRSALTSLAYSLQMAMAQKPLTESETPGRAHAQLRAIILDLARDVAALDRHPHPLLENGDSKVDTIENDFSSRAYEDILATAIVNKVMERSSNKSNKRNNNNFVSSLEVRVGSVEDSPESCTSSYTESWTSSGHSPQPSLDTLPTDLDSDPLSLMIEECIEEVTTITGPSSSGTASSASSLDECSEEEGLVREVPVVRRRRRRRSTQRRGSGPLYSGPPSVLAGLSFLKQRVPFPELGADIVDADWLSGESEVSENELAPPPECRDGSDGGSDGWQDAAEGSRADSRSGSLDSSERPASCLEVVTPLQSWEDNWLFQSRRVRKPAAQYSHHPVPVPMLVPNPSEDFRALIGDVDAEETSDLSECSDDALEEVVLNGLQPEGGRGSGSGSDQFSEERGHPSLEGLAETCNLELLRRTAPALSTAPAPRGQRTDRSPNADKSASSPTESEKTSTIQSAAKSPAKLANGGPPGRPQSRSPVDLAGRWARDQDAEMTILYDTPTRREAPAKRQPVSKTVTKPDAKPDAMPIAKPAVVDQNTVESKSRTAAEQVKVDKSEEKLEVKPEVNGKTKDHPELEVLSEPEAEEVHLKLNGDAKRPQEPTGASADEEEDGVDLFTPPRPGTIAEREHRKWQEATPLANNPYSPENIQRRLQQRASQPNLILGPAAPLAVLPSDTSLQIALRADPDPKKYGRDFYINSRSGDEPSSGLRRSHSTSVADRRNGHLEMPISPWCSGVRTNGDGGSEDGTQQTPSVKELAKQFIGQPQELMEPQQVHSLTARSMTREFREGLRHLAASSRAASRPAAPLSPLSPPGGPPRPATQPDRPDPEGARQPVDEE